MKTIQLSEVNLKNAIRVMMEDSQYDQFQQVAKDLDIPKTTFQSALNNEALRVRDLLKVADLLGYELVLEKRIEKA
ncbi:hypothetical protein ABEP17_10820 [Priestia flexa]|jgi:hypothetical protein|uniref:hypothetical protein n=1 Tax=Priestia flexa TaxID=86664 RepID=UPI003D2BA51C